MRIYSCRPPQAPSERILHGPSRAHQRWCPFCSFVCCMRSSDVVRAGALAAKGGQGGGCGGGGRPAEVPAVIDKVDGMARDRPGQPRPCATRAVRARLPRPHHVRMQRDRRSTRMAMCTEPRLGTSCEPRTISTSRACGAAPFEFHAIPWVHSGHPLRCSARRRYAFEGMNAPLPKPWVARHLTAQPPACQHSPALVSAHG